VWDAVLFDLDGTLLPLNMELFLPKYFQALAAKLELEVEPFVEQLLASTEKMIKNQGTRTNKEVFDSDFYRHLPGEPKELERLIDEFYEDCFPKLGDGIKPHPDAKRAVEAAFAITEHVVVATNPVFPKSAILARLQWAGLVHYPFSLITSYENMHSAKPNPQYYFEIAEKLCIDPRKALMIGNDVDEDLAASEVGMQTFLVDEMLINPSGKPIACLGRGSLAQCADFLEKYVRKEN
jgi:FMN phosphatase YigB (HAD superfamily)